MVALKRPREGIAARKRRRNGFTLGNATEVLNWRSYYQKHAGFNQIVKLNQLYDSPCALQPTKYEVVFKIVKLKQKKKEC